MAGKLLDRGHPGFPRKEEAKGSAQLRVLNILTRDSYEALERKLPAPAITADPTEAAVHLGIQMVLRELRNGFVSGQ